MVDQLLFLDIETSVHNGDDLPGNGHVRYLTDTKTVIRLIAFALGDEEPWTWIPGDVLPDDVRRHIESGGLIVAYNAQFDRWAWTLLGPEVGLPDTQVNQWLDAMAQASASGLPNGLDRAGQALGLGGKTDNGKTIMLRCGQIGYENATYEDWRKYEEYACRDVALMRDVWQRTMPLSIEDWQDYWVSEKINDRGLPMDLPLAKGAASFHEIEKNDVIDQIRRITKGEIKSQYCSKDLNKWVMRRLPENRQKLATTIDREKTIAARKKEPGCEPVRKASLQRKTLTRLRDTLKAAGEAPDVVELLNVLEWGRSASASKFQKIVDQSYEGRLYGAYVFNGAGQTGRYSSRGVQWHNTPRDRIGAEWLDDKELTKAERIKAMLQDESMALHYIRRRAPIDKLRQFGPLARTLSRASRPCIKASKGRRMVWADYSAIEARVLPWLAWKAGVPGAEEVLEMFRDGVDVYVENAAEIFGVAPSEVNDFQRHAGKVAVLALGFAGGRGAFQAMASNHGLVTDDDRADEIVRGWRDANRWSLEFNDRVWEAVSGAVAYPGEVWSVGVVSWQMVPHMMGGTLVCTLPSGRTICYPQARMVEEFDELLEFDVVNLRYGFGAERKRGWVGTFVENITQATANDVLRGALANLENDYFGAVGHTHDDIILEVAEYDIPKAKQRLVDAMLRPLPWATGLPLKAEAEDDVYYHK